MKKKIFLIKRGEILLTPSGMIYEKMVPADILVIDENGTVLEGKLRPNVDTDALLYIFRKRQEVKAIIHTHQPYATALGLISDQIICNLTTLANATRGAVGVAPYRSSCL